LTRTVEHPANPVLVNEDPEVATPEHRLQRHVDLPACAKRREQLSVSARVSGSRLIVTVFPDVRVKPIDFGASVPISTWPARIGSSMCITSFLSASGVAG